MNLSELKINESAIIKSINVDDDLRKHFLDMGLIIGSEVTLSAFAPLNDPLLLKVYDYELAIRVNDASNIEISTPYIKEKKENNDFLPYKEISHLVIDKSDKFHDHKHKTPLLNNEKLTFAFVGNQNCGKSTLFNQLTGMNQHVGNFPGVTVEQKSGEIKGHNNTLVTDLPGICSLSPYSDEEIVSLDFILKNDINGIINIVDATNIERNLYLTLQLLELNIPIVIALNMKDELESNGIYINIKLMEQLLQVPIILISAKTNEGVNELINQAIDVAYYQKKPKALDIYNNQAIYKAIKDIMLLIKDNAKRAKIPLSFATTKLIENDKLIIDALKLDNKTNENIKNIIMNLENEIHLDRNAMIAKSRYLFINSIVRKCVKKSHESKRHIISEKIDKVLTGKYTAIPIFILILGLVFFLTFNVIGAGLQKMLEIGIDSLTNLVDNAFTNMDVDIVLHSLVINGLFKGVGSVVSFLPIIIVLFFFLSMLEDSGYMARVAFIMDKLLRKIGLSGKSIVPLLIGFGCSVPAVMSTKTLSSKKDKKITILLTPFMSCSAKLPIYGYICKIFFKNYAWLFMIGLYVLGICIGILVAFIMKKTTFKGEASSFVMELPTYRLPGLKNVFQLLKEKTIDFLKRAFSIILVATLVIWFLQSFDFKFNYVIDSANSMLAAISGFISPIFKPLGFNDYRITTSLISGILAKESVVSSLMVLFKTEEALRSTLNSYSTICLLVFCLLYTPCIATIASIKKELGLKYSIIIPVFFLIIAYVVSLLFSLIFHIIGVM